MLLTISTTRTPATDLGFLLHKHPDHVHESRLPFGTARVVYPEATAERCTAALIVEVDPVGLVRGRKRGPGGRDGSLEQYVNDRPYAASSFLAVAMRTVFGTALSGRSKERPDLTDVAMPLEVHLPVVPCRGGPTVLRSLFEPLGYEISEQVIPLDDQFPEWGSSRYLDVRLHAELPVCDLLRHLFVLLPVLDDDKHYWVGEAEIDKLLTRGGTWLVTHPQRDLITRRYLRHDRRLTGLALARLLEEDVVADPDEEAQVRDSEEAAVEKPISLNTQRLDAVVAAVHMTGARSVVDLGCGSGNLLGRLLKDTDLDRILGIDVSHRALEVASRRLHLDTMSPRQRERIELAQGALTYLDARLTKFDLATLVEVIEHLDPPRLSALERSVFGYAHPRIVVVTTPNQEYNDLFGGLPKGSLRHRDHRFEWTRAELDSWAGRIANHFGYQVEITGTGTPDPTRGAPTQMALFKRIEAHS